MWTGDVCRRAFRRQRRWVADTPRRHIYRHLARINVGKPGVAALPIGGYLPGRYGWRTCGESSHLWTSVMRRPRPTWRIRRIRAPRSAIWSLPRRPVAINCPARTRDRPCVASNEQHNLCATSDHGIPSAINQDEPALSPSVEVGDIINSTPVIVAAPRGGYVSWR